LCLKPTFRNNEKYVCILGSKICLHPIIIGFEIWMYHRVQNMFLNTLSYEQSEPKYITDVHIRPFHCVGSKNKFGSKSKVIFEIFEGPESNSGGLKSNFRHMLILVELSFFFFFFLFLEKRYFFFYFFYKNVCFFF
jgi:hypothetical protein